MNRPAIVSMLVLTVAMPAFVFVLGGVAKLADPFQAARFIAEGLSVPLQTGFAFARLVAVLELLIGVGMCLLISRSLAPAYAALCLLAFFVGLLLTVVTSRPDAASCGCFGSLMAGLDRSLWMQVWIDLALALMIGVHFWAYGRLRRKAHVIPELPSTSENDAVNASA